MTTRTKIGRNEPCPCGSGKKYKHCCLKKDQEKTSKPIELDEKGTHYLRQTMEKEFFKMLGGELSQADELVFEGWELMAHDAREAKKSFERGLRLDPDLANAYNGLAEVAILKGNAAAAEEYYRKAYEKAKARLGTEEEKAFAWWGELRTRPYMRARKGLGLLLLEMRRYDEAIAEFKELLKRNPNDNQGVRYLVAPAFLLKGDGEAALEEFEWYRRHYAKDIPDPHFLFNWALALFMAGHYEPSAEKFRSTIFSNPYLIPLVLGEEPEELPIWHSSNLMQLDYAYEYFDWYAELWVGKGEAIRFLEFIWQDEEIQRDYEKWVELGTELDSLHEVKKRIPVLNRMREIETRKPSGKFLGRLGEFLAP